MMEAVGARGGRASRVLPAAALGLFLAGGMCVAGGASEPTPQVTARARFLMGTRLAITLPSGAPEEDFEAAFDEVARLEDVMSNWRGSSEIRRLNRAAGRGPFRCSGDLFDVIEAALRYAAETGGAFDPTVEPLVRALGLRGPEGRIPWAAAEASDAADAGASGGGEGGVVGWHHVLVDRRARTVRFDRDGVGIDLGGIGKGFALDAVARLLATRGVRSFLLDFGGQILAVGPPPGAPAWPVDVAAPDDRSRPAATVFIRDLSLSTSGDGERSAAGPNGPVGHILDPARGCPATFAGTVTVAAPDATGADALSTGLFVMGPEAGIAWAERHGIAVLYLAPGPGGGAESRASSAFRALLAARHAAAGDADGSAASAAPAGSAAPATPAAAGARDDRAELERRVGELERLVAALREEVARLRWAPAGSGGTSGDERIAALEKEVEALSSEIERLRIGEAAPPAAEGGVAGFGPAASKVYRASKGVSVGGYGEMLYQGFSRRRDDGSPSGEVARADLERAVLYVGYKLGDRALFNSEIEVEHAVAAPDRTGEAEVEFAYLDVRWRRSVGLRGGLLLVPVGFLNELHEPPIFLGSARPEVETLIIPTTWRENGLGVYGEAGPVSWRAYLVTGLDAAGFAPGTGIVEGRQEGSEAKAHDLALTGRLDVTPRPGLIVGVAGFSGDTGQGAAAFPAGRYTLWDAHLDWGWRGLHLRGLCARGSLADAGAVSLAVDPTGGTAIGSRQRGSYGEIAWDVLSLRRRGGAQLVPFLRYETLDTQARVAAGFTRDPANDRRIRTVGLVYRPIPNVAIKVDHQDVGDAAGTGVDRWNLALGYLF